MVASGFTLNLQSTTQSYRKTQVGIDFQECAEQAAIRGDSFRHTAE